MKSINEILTIIRGLAIPHFTGKINGQIYKFTRPTDSYTQDVVLNAYSGVSARFVNTSKLIINIFIKDIANGNTYYPDAITLSTMEKELYSFSQKLVVLNGFRFIESSRQITINNIETIHQSYVSLQINYQYLLQ